jgi:hypothetical protein
VEVYKVLMSSTEAFERLSASMWTNPNINCLASVGIFCHRRRLEYTREVTACKAGLEKLHRIVHEAFA